jgi:hypothetical protein
MSIDNKDRVSALTSLYAAERADLSTIGNQLTGISGLALTYIIAVFIVLGHPSTKKMSTLWLAAPIPVLIFLAFYTLFLSLSIARTSSCKKLEVHIAAETEIKADEIGMSISENVMDFERAPLLHKGLLITAYSPIILGSLLLTGYVAFQAFDHDTNIWIFTISATAYVILLIPIIPSWFIITFRR